MGTDTLPVAPAAAGATDTQVKKPPSKPQKQKGKKDIQLRAPAKTPPAKFQLKGETGQAKVTKSVKLGVVKASDKQKKQLGAGKAQPKPSTTTQATPTIPTAPKALRKTKHAQQHEASSSKINQRANTASPRARMNQFSGRVK
ncbi:hypothetical protein FQN49_006847 [Arthroderma sp. PD_2]|nr:hypothetical protein FQN49_006847 [Arthroderma sp. PD_2]